MSEHTESRELDAEQEALASAEIDLVRRAQNDDSEAFAELVRLYQRRAVSVAYRLLGNPEDASDVSQEAFIRAYRHLGQLIDPSRFGAWLLRTVSNLALNYRRSRKTRATVQLDESLADSADARQRAPGLGKTGGCEREPGLLSDELRTAISRALEQLPDKQRMALVLFSIEGLPQKQVAEILECSVELVKWNVFQARRTLKEVLKEHL